jgi:hypothetical protein
MKRSGGPHRNDIGQAFADLLRLGDPIPCQRRILLSLETSFGIPHGLAVPHEIDFGHAHYPPVSMTRR